ncbi:MAG: mannose-1-phosphate guanylyltransferase [Propionibacteriaceae bacterium]|jgi:mannose-1-phosphate guanylyltransferase|nr:mannose-1-phosphate guanylyltransferase [Propionibacteriaceae bacterium]
MRYVVIMAGGSGTRLWPLSRSGTPKQFLPLIPAQDARVSLLHLAVERARTVVPPERIWIVTGAAYLDMVRELAPEIPESNLLGEPVGRDSLNAAAWPAAVLAARDPDAVIAQLTADHLIQPVDSFARTLAAAFELAESGPKLVTLGVPPTRPHTGYGYIRRGAALSDTAFEVLGFTEKPPLALAQQYLASGEYWWNAGMFCWRAAAFLDLVAQLRPECAQLVLELAENPGQLADIFPRLPKISVDYAVMEPAAAQGMVCCVRLDAQWRDVGGYAALGNVLPQLGGNAASGRVVADAQGNVIINDDPDAVVAVAGVTGLVVVRTPTATLVVPADQAERVKALAEQVAVQAPGFE